jgi:ABC-type proline/glycine betaine transport system substrate-binding protein
LSALSISPLQRNATVTLVEHNWLSTVIATAIVRVILSELQGYDVRVEQSDNSGAGVGQLYAARAHFDIENWSATAHSAGLCSAASCAPRSD